MDIYEIIFRVTEGEYNSYLTIQVEKEDMNVDEAVEKAEEYVNNKFGIASENFELVMADDVTYSEYQVDKSSIPM